MWPNPQGIVDLVTFTEETLFFVQCILFKKERVDYK